jgi:hypothetical protein
MSCSCAIRIRTYPFQNTNLVSLRFHAFLTSEGTELELTRV